MYKNKYYDYYYYYYVARSSRAGGFAEWKLFEKKKNRIRTVVRIIQDELCAYRIT